MKQTLLSVIAACGLAVASSTNNSTMLPASASSEPFELVFPKAEPTKEQPWTIKVFLSRVNTKKSRFTGPSTTNLTLSLIGGNIQEDQGTVYLNPVLASAKLAHSGPYNTVSYELNFGEKYTGKDKRIADALADSRNMVDSLLSRSFRSQVICALIDDKGGKIAVSADPAARGNQDDATSISETTSDRFPQYREVANKTSKREPVGAQSLFFVWGTRMVSNVTCRFDSSTSFFLGAQSYQITLEDKLTKGGSNQTSGDIQSYTKLKHNHTGVTEQAPRPPNNDDDPGMLEPMLLYPLPPIPSNGSFAKPEASPKGRNQGFKNTALDAVKRVSKLPWVAGAKQEYSKVTMEIGEVLRPDSRCQILDPAGKAISVTGEDGKTVTHFSMGRYTFHEPKRSAVGKILCGTYLGQ